MADVSDKFGVKRTKGAATIPQHRHVDQMNADKIMDGLLAVGEVKTGDPSTSPVLVGKGNVCRIKFSSGTNYVAFGSSNASTPTSSTSPALELDANAYYLVVATDDYLVASANPSRLEVING